MTTKLDRKKVQALPEHDKNRFRAEALNLLVKAESGAATDTERARLRDLVRCGMLPSDPPPQGVRPERRPALREHARQRFEAFKKRAQFKPVFLDNIAESEFIHGEFFRLVSASNAEVAEIMALAKSKAIRGHELLSRLLKNRTIAKYHEALKSDQQVIAEAELLDDDDVFLLALLVTPDGKTRERDYRKRRDKFMPYAEIGKILDVSPMAVHRRAIKLADTLKGSHPILFDSLQKAQSRRMPRGTLKKTVTKSRKIKRRKAT